MLIQSSLRAPGTPPPRAPPRAFASELGADDHELVVQDLVGHLAVALRADLALEPADAAVLGDKPHDLDALLALLLEPGREGASRRDEGGDLVARVEVLALPVHLVG